MRLHTFFSLLGLALLLALNLPAQTVRVIYVKGQADLQRPDEPTSHQAQKGETVIIGTRITTGPDGRIVLTPMPGVTSMIAPNTIITLESSSDSHPSANTVIHQATLDLQIGAVVTDLKKQPGASFDYSIRTPRGLAGARGTTFTVGLNLAGIETIVVSHGTINLTLSDGRTVSLTIGQVSITQPGGGTAQSGKAGDLSPADRALAENWVKITLETLADAVDAGIVLQPDALANALATARSLGIPIPKELEQRVEILIANPPEKTTTTTSTNDPSLPPDTVINPPDTTDDSTIPPPDFLNDNQKAVFNSLSHDAQVAIVTLDDDDITVVALSPDETGLTPSNSDIIHYANALIALKNDPVSYAFFKELAGAVGTPAASIPRGPNGGTQLPHLDTAPDPTEWSAAAFARSASMWNSTALSPTQKQQLIAFGSGSLVMDRLADYLIALLDAYGSLSSTDRSNLVDAGWGPYLDGLANNPTNFSLTSALALISNYDSNQLGTLADMHISPTELLGSENFEHPVGDLLTALNTLSPADLTTLLQLDAGHDLLQAYNFYDGTAGQYVGFLSDALAFYKTLTNAQNSAVRAIGVGDVLFYNSPTDTVGYGTDQTPITVGDRIKEIAQFYIDNPSDQQSMRDMHLFDGSEGYIFIYGPSSNTTLLRQTITTYNALSARTRAYLASEGNQYSFLQLFFASYPDSNPVPRAVEVSPYRSLDGIEALLQGLTAAEYDDLLDIDGAKAVVEVGHLGGPDASTELSNLKTFLDFYETGLDDTQKSLLRELGVVGNDSTGNGSVAFLGSDPADHAGLGRLLKAYSQLSGTLLASTERLYEDNSYGSHFGNSMTPGDRSYFFPYGETQTTLTNVSFEAQGDLYVGATKYLVLDDTLDSNVSFTVSDGHDIALRASNLIDLTGTTFSAGVRTITMEAATINLTNIDFPGGAGVYLNSKLGGTSNGSTGSGAYPHFGSSAPGRVNFIGGVTYNGNTLNNTSTFDAHSNGNIHIGTLTNPVVAPPKQVNN